MPNYLAKIKQLLRSDEHNNQLLAIELLQSTREVAVLSQMLSDQSYMSYMVCYPLVPFFQQNAALWEQVKSKIPNHKQRNIEKWLPRKLLTLKKDSVAAFCQLANQAIKEHFDDFPQLQPSILTEFSGYGVGSTRSGKAITDGIGWSLEVEARDVGPAEVIHEEEWTAVAHHPKYHIKIRREDSKLPFLKVWMQKV